MNGYIGGKATTRQGGYQSKTIRGNYDYDRELSSIDTVPAYILSKLYVFGHVVGHLESYRTHVLPYSTYVLLYSTMVLMARPTKVRC